MDKQTQQTMFSSQSSEWATPQVFFERLNWRFGPFNLHPCASPDNAKCDIFYTEADDGLSKSWKGRIVFINPPYGRGVDEWVKKAYEETEAHPNTRVVMLLPARTDTKYWHNYVMKAKEIHFIKGRLKFGDATNAAPFPSAVVVFENTAGRYLVHMPMVSSMERV